MTGERYSNPSQQQRLPRRGNRLTACFGRVILKLCGWNIRGALPEQPKLLVIVAPHTSNWDFVIGIAAVVALCLDANWVGKHTLFRGVCGKVMTWFGGIPVDRRMAHGVVDQLVAEFQQREHLFLGITPEGTRSRVDRWKTGFYHIARQANIPLVPVCFDYHLKQMVIFPPFSLSGDLEHDLVNLQQVFAEATPKIPSNYNTQIY